MKYISWLCAAATRSNLIEKTREFSADIAIFDFEDALHIDDKENGRWAYFNASKETKESLAVRINALNTRLGLQDILFFLEQDIVPDMVILPKSGFGRDISIIWELLGEKKPNLKVFPVIETIQGFRAMRNLVDVPKCLGGFHFGAADLAADLGLELNRAKMNFYREEIAFVAKSLGVAAIDSPCFEIKNEHVIRSECEAAKQIGYAGKIAIHPCQVDIINSVFKISEDTVRRAESLINRHLGNPIMQDNGSMTGPPFVRFAEKIIMEMKTNSPGNS